MQIITIDFETYFDKEYTLSKLSTEEYIRDPRFEAHGAAIRWEAPLAEAQWFDACDLPAIFEADWSKIMVLCHHTHFDGLILSHHYGVKPYAWLDTLSMARLLLGNHLSVSLDSVRKHFDMPLKTTPYKIFEGKHWSELSSVDRMLIAAGCCDEVNSIWTIFKKLGARFPGSQYRVVDNLIRMFVDPVLVGDTDFFGRIWFAEEARKRDLKAELGVTGEDLQSSARFAGLLRERGVEPENTNGKNGDIYAFAKTDDFMVNLLDDPDPEVAALAAARLGIKSTIQQTRAARYGDMSTRGRMAAYLRPYGARTTRPSGGDKTNWLNLKKTDPDLPLGDSNATLKEGLVAPEGFLLAAIDSSQIECRLLNWFAGQEDVLDTFRKGNNPYSQQAEAFYGYPVDKFKNHVEYQLGKIVELQSGYGSGGLKIRLTLKHKAGIILDEWEGVRARNAYRDTHRKVVQLWHAADAMFPVLTGGDTVIRWKCLTVADGCLWLPNGCPLIYDTLEQNDEGWRVQTRNGWQRLYGAKLVENICQALAWNLTSDAMVRITTAGFRVLNAPYDELLVLIPRDGHEQEALAFCLNEMRQVPEWAPGLPLYAEGKLQERYG